MRTSDITRRSALGLVSALPFLGAATPVLAQALVKMKLLGAAAVARPDQGFIFLGIPLGFYKQGGVDADFLTVAGSGTVIQLIGADQAQLGHSGMQELMAAKKERPDLPVRAVFLQEIGSGYEIVVPESGPIQSLGQLKDKKIGVMSLASGAVPFVKAMLRKADVKEDTVELLPVGTGAQALAALEAHRVDALSLFRGQHAAIENLGITFRYFTVPYPSSVLVTNENFLKSTREALVHALQGVVLDQVFMTTNPEAAVREFWKMFGEPKGDRKKALQDGVHLITRAAELWKKPNDGRKWGAMADQDWLGLAKFAGMDMDERVIRSLYTDELIDDVNKVDVEVAVRAARKA
jgi:NitT/TauT family transport system substrate-binding protein